VLFDDLMTKAKLMMMDEPDIDKGAADAGAPPPF
jgi:hypothetical protein